MKKKILVGLFCLVSSLGFGQDENIEKLISESNFKIVDNELIYQKIYFEKISLLDFQKSIIAKNSLENISIIDSTLFGSLKWFNLIPIEGLKFPIYMMEYLSGNVKVDFRSDKYRITISNIRLKSMAGAGLFKDVSGNSVETQLILYYYKPFKKEKIARDGFYLNDAKIIESNFLRLLEFKSMKSDF
jgi:hypothetical protein